MPGSVGRVSFLITGRGQGNSEPECKQINLLVTLDMLARAKYGADKEKRGVCD